jgi:hypothetical protein
MTTEPDRDSTLTPAAGQTWADSAGEVAVLVLCAPGHPGRLRYDGRDMTPARPPACTERVVVRHTYGSGLQEGERYINLIDGIVVRCLRGGEGELSFAGHPFVRVGSVLPAGAQRRRSVPKAG